MRRKVLVFSLLILCFLSSDIVLKKCHAIWLTLPSTGTKCVSEEIQNNVVVLADYVVVSDDPSQLTPTIAVKVLFIQLRSSINYFILFVMIMIILSANFFFTLFRCDFCLNDYFSIVWVSLNNANLCT